MLVLQGLVFVGWFKKSKADGGAVADAPRRRALDAGEQVRSQRGRDRLRAVA